MFASHNTKARSAFIAATIAALLIAFSPNLHAQSPLTVQPSTISGSRSSVDRFQPAVLFLVQCAHDWDASLQDQTLDAAHSRRSLTYSVAKDGETKLTYRARYKI